jgi:hypothetical protein
MFDDCPFLRAMTYWLMASSVLVGVFTALETPRYSPRGTLLTDTQIVTQGVRSYLSGQEEVSGI